MMVVGNGIMHSNHIGHMIVSFCFVFFPSAGLCPTSYMCNWWLSIHFVHFVLFSHKLYSAAIKQLNLGFHVQIHLVGCVFTEFLCFGIIFPLYSTLPFLFDSVTRLGTRICVFVHSFTKNKCCESLRWSCCLSNCSFLHATIVQKSSMLAWS